MTTLNLDALLASLEQDAQIEKTASVTEDVKPAVSAELAGILEKKASADLTKQAFSQGEELARELLAKFANEIQEGNDAMVADDNQKVTSNETAGDVESVLQNTVDKAVASGATTEDRVNHETTVNNVVPAGGPVGAEKQAEEAATQDKETTTMDKAAQENKALAKSILEKLAQEFSPQTTTPAAAVNVAAAPAPNKIQADNASMTAQHDAIVEGVVPGGDQTVNALFETIVAKAKAQGGQSDDLINGAPSVQSRQTQGIDGTPSSTTGESVKMAEAVSYLCGEGLDFDSAVALVKQAEAELIGEDAEEALELQKRACMDILTDAGIDFDTAVALIKEAEEDLRNAE